MISRHRRVWASTDGSTSSSGQIGAVPATTTRSPTRTARLNPATGSNGLPDEIRRRSIAGTYRASPARFRTYCVPKSRERGRTVLGMYGSAQAAVYDVMNRGAGKDYGAEASAVAELVLE